MGLVLAGLVVYFSFDRGLSAPEQTHFKTLVRIMFVAGQTLVKIPFNFAISFPFMVSSWLIMGRVPTNLAHLI